jgi:hypothetical protein
MARNERGSVISAPLGGHAVTFTRIGIGWQEGWAVIFGKVPDHGRRTCPIAI